MGDLRDWSPETKLEDRPSIHLSLSSQFFCANQVPTGREYWRKAEAAVQGIIAQVQPTVVSEKRRKAVIDYVQRLIRVSLGCEVFPFGSVPLKTYLPDGDIDLTAFGGLNLEESLATDVCSILEREDQNDAAEFIVKDVQLIRAEVKLVKCLVQNIIVDISFNQIGGLCTLCFLEQVDRLIGKSHLFKRSIILIKAWCYYESRILGAHHGLISTYALETLVLYIFHLFHTSLDGPLAVLYKFLEYFSKFDWDNYCISLLGPVRISSLPEIVAETPENGGGDLLLSSDFLKGCAEMFSVPPRGLETNSRGFHPKHLNIIDPLKENNNLGRSVSKGNFYRIKSAFSYGARKLRHILSQPEENKDVEIHKFFSNTLDRHGRGQRPDVQDPVPMVGQDGLTSTAKLDVESRESELCNSSSLNGESRLDHEELCDRASKIKVSGKEMIPSTAVNESQYSLEVACSKISSQVECSINETVSNHSMSHGEDGVTPICKPPHTPHLYFSRAYPGERELKNGNADKRQVESLACNKKLSSQTQPTFADMTVTNDKCNQHQVVINHGPLHPLGSNFHVPLQSNMVAWSSEDVCPSYSGCNALAAGAASQETSTSLSDLSGDFESHLNSLYYGRWCYDYAAGASMVSPLSSYYSSKRPWDVIRRSVQFKQNMLSQVNHNTNGIFPAPFYPLSPPILPAVGTFSMEEIPKPRGTGTYIPNVNHYREKTFPAKGKGHAPVRSPRSHNRPTASETNFIDRSCREQAPQPSVQQSGFKFDSSDHVSNSAIGKVYKSFNGLLQPSEDGLEFRPVGQLSVDMPKLENSRKPQPGSPTTVNPIGISSPGGQRLISIPDRTAAQGYHLKDDDDFPPLSV